ncbi:CsiV family protein [Marinospirillum sp. MEB164]|uniref:CsiV family protein n=1 Tax=Marinospirillum alkalitolerans TaxID=3123374 RepID=A0ABW8PVV5_9GAMM
MKLHLMTLPQLTCRLLGGLLLLGLISPLSAEVRHNEREYRVEILIFAQEPGEGASERPGAPYQPAHPANEALSLGATPFWHSLSQRTHPQVRSLPTQLNRQARALERSDDYRLLFHEAFQMHLVGRDRTVPLLIEGGERVDGHPELLGQLHLSVARFLHLETDLHLNHFEHRATQLTQPHANSAEDITSLLSEITASSPMQQRRRMRSSELHFIDSPQLGLLILIERAE